MDKLSEADLDGLLGWLARGLEALYGERYRGLVLYGSYARGEADEGSDVDILLLLDGKVNVARELRYVEPIVWPLSLELEIVVSLLPVSVERYRNGKDPFMLNVRREGIPAA